jgi:hypothetical protein
MGEEGPDRDGRVGAKLEVALHPLGAEIEVAVAHADEFVDLGVGIVEGEGWSLGDVENLGAASTDLEGAGGELGILGALGTAGDLTLDGEDILGARLIRDEGRLRGLGGVEDDLNQAGAVAEVDEDEATMVAAAVDPTVEDDGLAKLGLVDLAAAKGSLHETDGQIHLGPPWGPEGRGEFGG